MTLQFTNTAQASVSHGIKVLVYGRSGAGKTMLAATAPAPIILSAESGTLSLRKAALPVIVIRTVDDLTEALQWLTHSPHARPFQTVYMDSITEIGEVVLANAKRQVKDPRQAFGELIEKMTSAIKGYRDLPGKHVVMVAKQESYKDDLTGITMYGPSMPGQKLGPSMPYLYDEVFRLGIGKTPQGVEYRFLQTATDLQYDAKDRSGALDAVEPPDLNHIFTKIMGAIK
jgi:hypothetical protein